METLTTAELKEIVRALDFRIHALVMGTATQGSPMQGAHGLAVSRDKIIAIIEAREAAQAPEQAPAHKTEKQAREEFCNLYEALRADGQREGYSVNKSDEWERFITHEISEGRMPESAKSWRMPRSTR